MCVNLGFPKLVEVPEELKDMSTTASGEGKWGSVVAKVLPKSVPVSSFLVLIATRSGRWRC